MSKIEIYFWIAFDSCFQFCLSRCWSCYSKGFYHLVNSFNSNNNFFFFLSFQLPNEHEVQIVLAKACLDIFFTASPWTNRENFNLVTASVNWWEWNYVVFFCVSSPNDKMLAVCKWLYMYASIAKLQVNL